jgi:hypothetical protein
MLPFFERPKGDEQGVWAKLPLVNETLNSGKYDWVLWMDFDTLFTNLSIKMEDFISDARENHLAEGQSWDEVSIIAAPDW